MTLKRVLLPVAALTFAAACSEMPGAPAAAPGDVSTATLLEPPPPPMTGKLLYDAGTGDGLAAGTSARNITVMARQDDCELVTFCVPARYFLNRPGKNEWLDVDAEEPLPADIKRQLETVGAACGVEFDDQTDGGRTIFCPVGSTAAGRFSNRRKDGGGSGLAYDVSRDGLTATTVSLDQLDVFEGKALICRRVEGGGAICTTPPVFGDVWAGTVGDDGSVTYVRTARVLSPFHYVGGTAVVLPPDVIP